MSEWRNVGRASAGLLVAGLMAVGCTGDIAEPFEVRGTGSLEGLVFFDADEDGVFTPTAGDTALAGVTVAVRERSTEQTFNNGVVTTGANGRFQVADLPLGTHDLLVDTLTAPASLRFCQNPLPVTVYRGETSYAPVKGQASCLITIAAAEELAADAEYVTVAGVITSSPGQIRSGYTFIQDATGGVLVFGTLDPALEVGDYIEVSGTIVLYYNTVELTNPVLKNRVPGYGPAAPEVVTTAEVSSEGAAPDSYIQGLLVTVRAAELTVEFGGGGINERNAKIDDGSGQAELRIYEGVVEDAATLNDLMSVGTCYDITGVVGEFSQTGQIYPRTPDDIEAVPCN